MQLFDPDILHSVRNVEPVGHRVVSNRVGSAPNRLMGVFPTGGEGALDGAGSFSPFEGPLGAQRAVLRQETT